LRRSGAPQGRGDLRRQLPEQRREGELPSPGQHQRPGRGRRGKRAGDERAPRVLDGDRELGEERDPCPARDHLREGAQAGGPEVRLVRVRPRADGERLIAQAMAFVQQQQGLSFEVRDPRWAASPRQGVRLRRRQQEPILDQPGGLETGHPRHARHQRGIDRTLFQIAKQRFRALLDPADLQGRQLAPDGGHRLGQEIGGHRRDDADAQRGRARV